ncbi:MAG: hypothetical protein Q7R83_03165 [bacterium]|nr:hypothetical protein [bacterium]
MFAFLKQYWGPVVFVCGLTTLSIVLLDNGISNLQDKAKAAEQKIVVLQDALAEQARSTMRDEGDCFDGFLIHDMQMDPFGTVHMNAMSAERLKASVTTDKIKKQQQNEATLPEDTALVRATIERYKRCLEGRRQIRANRPPNAMLRGFAPH